MTAAPTTTPLTVKTTISDLKPGDVFHYQSRPDANFRSSPILTAEHIGGQPVVSDPQHTYPEAMYRIRHEDSDTLGTLYYGHETVWRAKRH